MITAAIWFSRISETTCIFQNNGNAYYRFIEISLVFVFTNMDAANATARCCVYNLGSSLLHSVNLILFTVLLVHLILRISPHHSHHLCSHHLSLPLPFTPDLKLISFTDPFLHSHSYSFRTDFTDLNLY